MYLYLLLYLHLYLFFIYLHLNPRRNLNLHIGLGVYATLQDIQCCWKLLRLVHEIITYTAVEMGMHDQVVPCHPLLWIDSQPAMSERGIWHATQIERQRNETHDTGNRRRKDSL